MLGYLALQSFESQSLAAPLGTVDDCPIATSHLNTTTYGVSI